ncbi:helicase-associated domain-containing protein [Cryobacterium tepidiphilum]|uniref:Helicase XPB/Ssl2 N-terminal domain-containing protein n=1 Tax=Cryobacterium tepidiphilum TaxID=2486026 RepID=A0A3M8KWY9_9MICO|nr:helicase-associated domain-containing protein [Cryobacterium tepidiphilum]RNE56982.1 hypothetical protein EEJ31_12525 [Cryobacterium tepidiphilum]
MLTLATRLRASEDHALRRAVRVRDLGGSGIRDFFDLAEAFLSPDALQQAFTGLERFTLAVLAVAAELDAQAAGAETAGAAAPELAAIAGRLAELRGASVAVTDVRAHAALLDDMFLGVLDGDRFSPYAAAAQRLAAWPTEVLPGTRELAADRGEKASPTPDASDVEVADRLAAERAFAVVSSITELVTGLAREPVRELSRGGLGLPDTRRLAEIMAVEPESVAPLVAIARNAGLVGLIDGQWVETNAGEAWLREGSAARWATVAAAWNTALPENLRPVVPTAAGSGWGDALRASTAWQYPAGGQRMRDQVDEIARDAALLGITARDITSTAGAAVLAGDHGAAALTISAFLPPEVEQVYLQNDLSVVAPGPMAPAIDARLRLLADVESRELASSYRISAASVNRALAAGETADSLLDFLRGISLTGIPQPLEYQIREAASRYGKVRVGTVRPTRGGDGPPAQSYVRSGDAVLLRTISVDQSLASLGLVRDGDRLVSRFPAEPVFWALTDAKYPVAAENADGEVLRLRRHQPGSAPKASVADPAAALVEKVRASDGDGDTGQAWLVKQLEAAIRTRQAVTVNIAMPDGVVVDYLLEPASIGGGRFRAKDRRADIERTVPLSSVISITVAP